MPLAETNARRVTDIFAVNVLGPSLLAAEALPYLKEARGAIINVSSTFGSKAVPDSRTMLPAKPRSNT